MLLLTKVACVAFVAAFSIWSTVAWKLACMSLLMVCNDCCMQRAFEVPALHLGNGVILMTGTDEDWELLASLGGCFNFPGLSWFFGC